MIRNQGLHNARCDVPWFTDLARIDQSLKGLAGYLDRMTGEKCVHSSHGRDRADCCLLDCDAMYSNIDVSGEPQYKNVAGVGKVRTLGPEIQKPTEGRETVQLSYGCSRGNWMGGGKDK
jgi:hypothetical protein